MSLKQNDVYYEQLMDYLRDLDGVVMEGETVEEAIEKEEWCREHHMGLSRKYLGKLLEELEGKKKIQYE